VSGLDRLAADALAVAHERRRTPGATYRLQFHAGFTLRDALALVPYFDSLGVTHLYASPLLTARPGSTHGYDIIDHNRLNPEIGTEADLAALTSALRERGMGLILDVVPNHMCVTSGNAWWADVLEHGPSSPFAGYFDIAWYDSPRIPMHGRLLLPVLGEPYGQVLEAGQLKPSFKYGGFFVSYWEAVFPLDPRTYDQILTPALAVLREQLGSDSPDVIELQSILRAIRYLPPREEADLTRLAEGRAECGVIKRRLSELVGKSKPADDAIAAAVEKLAGTPGDPASFAALDTLLEAQAYRVSFWRVASDEINYRRFFDINELAALSTEREDVFRAVHRKWMEWAASGYADGFRIDHPDGLFNPKQYLDRLQTYFLLAVAEHLLAEKPEEYDGAMLPRDERELLEILARVVPAPLPVGKEKSGSIPVTERPAPPTAESTPPVPLYVVVEKILGEGESLQPDWVCDGTAGYEFVTAVNRLFVDPAGEASLTAAYERFTGRNESFYEAAHNGKSLILDSSLASELWSLAHQLDRIARLDRRSRDFTPSGIRGALREVIACFPVYRSYVDGGASANDKSAVGRAIHRARKRNPTLGKPLFDFIRDTVLLKDSPSGPATEEYRQLQRQFAGKFQQVTAPVTAKGVEDTALYIHNRLVSLNEVGGEPARFGWPPERVHKFLTERGATQPGGLSPLSTHDAKRSEDVRARVNVLSELPDEWGAAVEQWSTLNRGHKTEFTETEPAPDANEEWYLYQTLIGVWEGTPTPEFVARLQAHMKKALCEAKVHSSWINPDAEYESAVANFVQKILDPAVSGEFLAKLSAFAERVAFFGRVNSIAQTVIRCAAPGVPDTYQGTELWELSLVDPDNRRPVDYDPRTAWMNELDQSAKRPRGLCRLALELSKSLTDPRAKLFATSRVLRCRRAYSSLFAKGNYIPLPTTGTHADNLFAFARVHNLEAAVVAVPRLVTKLVPTANRPPLGRKVWGDTAVSLPDGMPHGLYHNVLTGERVELSDAPTSAAELFGVFPAAVLIRETGVANGVGMANGEA